MLITLSGAEYTKALKFVLVHTNQCEREIKAVHV